MSSKPICPRYLLALLALVGVALLAPATATAHTELIGSDPPDGAEVATGPSRVSLTFTLPVQRGFTTVTVTGPDGSQWQSGPATEDGAVVSAPVRPLGPAGRYTIAYRVLAADGHPIRGAVRFSLTTSGAAAPALTADRSPGVASTASAGQTQAGSGWLGLAALVGAGIVVIGCAVVALRIRRAG
ncbi:MAG: copper resistance CopC family protein [Pseudonocardiaceae bacterium]